MGCIGSRTVGGYRGGARRQGSAGSGPPAPSPTAPRAPPRDPSFRTRPVRPRFLTLPPRPRGPCLHLSPLSSRAPPGLASLRALCILLPLASFRRPPPGAVPLHHTPTGILSVALPYSPVPAPSTSRPCLPQPPRPTPCPEQPPLRRTPQPQSQPRDSFARAPPPTHPPHPASIRLGCFAPISFLLRCLFLLSLPPPICFVHVHFPSGAGAG